SIDLLQKTPFPDRAVEFKTELHPGALLKRQVNPRGVQSAQIAFLKNFARQVSQLKVIAGKHLQQQPLSKAETEFLKTAVQQSRMGSGWTYYNGGFRGLFYAGKEDSGKGDALVADVPTDPPAPIVGDPGCVLTQGVGSVDLMIIAIDNGQDRLVYAGPVL